eukprot:3435127-Amphidinium_carterae.3
MSASLFSISGFSAPSASSCRCCGRHTIDSGRNNLPIHSSPTSHSLLHMPEHKAGGEALGTLRPSLLNAETTQ